MSLPLRNTFLRFTMPALADGSYFLRARSVDASGNVLDTNGLLPGLKRGKPTTEYVEKWFFELPSDTLAPGSTWTRELPENNTETSADSAAAKEDVSEEEKATKSRGR